MLKFIWEDDERVGYYQCQLVDDTNNKVFRIVFQDNTCPFCITRDKRHKLRREFAYEISSYSGLNKKGIDRTEDDNSFEYVGKPKHSIDDIKRYCENYLAAQIINEYYDLQKQINFIKNSAEELLKMGYSKEFEDI